jgi:hypothetical protein
MKKIKEGLLTQKEGSFDRCETLNEKEMNELK